MRTLYFIISSVIIAFFIALFITLPLTASQSAPSSARLPGVLVQDTAIDMPNPLDTADVTTINKQKLKSASSLVEVLRQVPGAILSQSGGVGQPAWLSLRGAGTEHTAVVLDGMRLNEVGAFKGRVDLSPWLVDDLSQVQVIQGPLSSLYGSDAIGGTLIMQTEKGKGTPKTFAGAEAGSCHAFRQTGGIQGQRGAIDYHVRLSRFQSAGTPLTPPRLRYNLTGKTNDPLHQENFSARLGAGNETASLTWFSRYLTRRSSYRQIFDSYRQNLTEQFNRLQGNFTTRDGEWNHEMGLSYYANDRDNEDSSGLPQGDNRGTQLQGDWRQNIIVNDRTGLQIGTELAREQFFTTKPASATNPFISVHAHSNRAAVSSTLAIRMSEPLTVTLSLRADKYAGLSPGMTARLGGKYSFGNTIFTTSVGTGFRSPSLSERFYKSHTYRGNPDLKPEKSLGWDAGVARDFFHKRLNIGFVVFQNHLKNMITFLKGTVVNSDKAKTQGIENIFKYQMNATDNAQLSLACLQTRDEQTGQKLIRRPTRKITFCITTFLTPQWQFSGNAVSVGSQIDYDRAKIPSYIVFGAQTSWQINEQWEIYGKADNILNRQFENPRDYQQPGLNMMAGVRKTW